MALLETSIAKMRKLAFLVTAFPLVEPEADLGTIRCHACALALRFSLVALPLACLSFPFWVPVSPRGARIRPLAV